MDIGSKKSGDQRMSEIEVNVRASSSSRKNSSAKLYAFFQQEGDEYQVYARLGKHGSLEKRVKKSCLRVVSGNS
jgi:hypothetical protein